MLIFRTLDELALASQPLHLALGVFDGVHVGHREVIQRTIDEAAKSGGLSGVLTFDPHPIRVIAPAKAPSALLETLEHKAKVVGALGVDVFVPLHFDEALAGMEAQEFIRKLSCADVRTIAVGEDWRFGHLRGGDATLLRNLSATCGFRLEAVPPVMHDGERVSSTRIRQAIRDGNLVAAAAMLGRPYAVTGRVVEGRKIGRSLGFPTANLATGQLQLPPDGVWGVRTLLPDSSIQPGVANLGFRPTVDGLNHLLEVHLLDVSPALYGCDLEVTFEKFLRTERRFESRERLQEQIHLDVREARAYFENDSDSTPNGI